MYHVCTAFWNNYLRMLQSYNENLSLNYSSFLEDDQVVYFMCFMRHLQIIITVVIVRDLQPFVGPCHFLCTVGMTL
jgi:hypothetical protein